VARRRAIPEIPSPAVVAPVAAMDGSGTCVCELFRFCKKSMKPKAVVCVYLEFARK
jgi:hypothetical protein